MNGLLKFYSRYPNTGSWVGGAEGAHERAEQRDSKQHRQCNPAVEHREMAISAAAATASTTVLRRGVGGRVRDSTDNLPATLGRSILST